MSIEMCAYYYVSFPETAAAGYSSLRNTVTYLPMMQASNRR